MVSRRSILVLLLSLVSPLGFASAGRKSYQDSCKFLQVLGLIDKGKIPPLPDHRPRYDDPEPLGVSFIRTEVKSEQLSNLTLPKTFFGRSEIVKVNFENSDLSEATLCWNDFVEVNFSRAKLTKSDLRASIYVKVRFDQADLRGADLRRSSFEACSFAGADMTDAIATRKQQTSLALSKKQRIQISWAADDGEEPGGG